MDLFDRLALFGRRYERRHSAITGGTRLTLEEVLRMFNDKTILDIETKRAGQEPRRVQHATGRPVALLDGIAEIDAGGAEWYEVFETAPSGDYARARIISFPSRGELSMLVGRRMPEHSNADDPVLKSLTASSTQT